MATQKGKQTSPVAYKSKSKSTDGHKYVAITILVEETGNSGYKRSTVKKPLFMQFFENHLMRGNNYGFGDWAVKSLDLTEEQFKEAYDAL